MEALQHKPRLPDTFFKASWLDFARSLVYMLALWLIPACLSLLVFHSQLPFGVKIALYLFFGWVSGHGVIWSEWIGHDAVHGSLLRNRKLGLFLSLAISPAIPGFMNMGFAARHLDHHRHTNQKDDPDTHHYARYKNIASRMLLSRAHKNLSYVLAACLAWRGDTKHRLPGYSMREMRLYVAANFIFVGAWLGLYSWLATTHLPLFVFAVALPTVSLILSTGCLTYQQHGGTGDAAPEDYWRNTRSLTSRWWSFLYGGGNFHLEHHLYPRVPVWRLPDVHAYLKTHGFFDRRGVHIDDSGIFGGYRYFSSSVTYPSPE